MTAPADADAARKGSVLLVVDDEPDIRTMVATVAARACPGMRVEVAANAADALAIVRAGEVRAILTDLRMPGKSGIDLLLAAKAQFPDLRCAIMTGYLEDDVDGISLASLRLVGLLRKPFALSAVRELMVKLTA